MSIAGRKSIFRLSLMNLLVYLLITVSVALTQMLGLFAEVDEVKSFQATISDNMAIMLDDIEGSSVASWLLLFIFMVIVGTILMLVVRKLLNFILSTKEHIEVATTYKHASDFDQGNYWGSAVVSILLRAMTVAGIILYSAIWLIVLFPSTKGMFYVESSQNIAYEDIFIASFALPLSLHVFVVLFRALNLRFRS